MAVLNRPSAQSNAAPQTNTKTETKNRVRHLVLLPACASCRSKANRAERKTKTKNCQQVEQTGEQLKQTEKSERRPHAIFIYYHHHI